MKKSQKQYCPKSGKNNLVFADHKLVMKRDDLNLRMQINGNKDFKERFLSLATKRRELESGHH